MVPQGSDFIMAENGKRRGSGRKRRGKISPHSHGRESELETGQDYELPKAAPNDIHPPARRINPLNHTS